MSAPPLRKLTVDLHDLQAAMEFRPSDTLEPQTPYLDRQTGEVVWVFESDEEYAATMNDDAEVNARLRAQVEAEPDRFVYIPESDSFDDNEMLREFLRSEWTDDESLRREAEDAYRGSVGRWKRAIGHNQTILHAWRVFEDQSVCRRAREFLAEHGIEPAG